MASLPDNPKTRRKHYAPDVYARLTSELTQLINQTPHLIPQRDTWDIEGDWNDAGEMHFIDQLHMSRFAQYAPFDCRTIKLINYGQPAIRMTFYQQHRYWLLKNNESTSEEKKTWLTEYVNKMIVKAQILEDKARTAQGPNRTNLLNQIAHHYREVNIWKPVLYNIEQYDIALSNYHRMHYYTQINFKYWISHEDATLANSQQHLLNPQRDRSGNINEMRHNVVFIDSADILRKHAYQNKEADKFLARFDMKTDLGRAQIFARLRPNPDTTVSLTQANERPTTKTSSVDNKNDHIDFGPLFS